MKLIKQTGFALSAIALAATASFAHAEAAVDEVARGGLTYLKASLADTLDDMQAAIGANTTGVQNNATANAQNAADISKNSNDIQALQSQATPSYDYRTYSTSPDVASKVYNISGIGSCDTETRTFERTTTGDVTDEVLTRVRTSAGSPCGYHKFKFQNTPEGRFRVGVANYNGSGSFLRSTVSLDKPMIMRTSNMKIGEDIGDGTTSTFVDFQNGGLISKGTYIRKTVMLAEDSTTVALNDGTTLEGCARFHITHESTYGFGTGPVDRIEYHCPGLGMVKRIQANGAYYELRDVTYK